MKRLAILFLVIWLVAMVLLSPVGQPTYADWLEEEVKWGIP